MTERETIEDAINTILWFYHRAKPTYGRLPHAERSVAALEALLGHTAPTEDEQATHKAIANNELASESIAQQATEQLHADVAVHLDDSAGARSECGAGGWISVEDRLPDAATRVLAYTPSGDKGTAWRIVPEGLLRTTSDVTHWMPLPDAPALSHLTEARQQSRHEAGKDKHNAVVDVAPQGEPTQ
jgi:hypothetical protein